MLCVGRILLTCAFLTSACGSSRHDHDGYDATATTASDAGLSWADGPGAPDDVRARAGDLPPVSDLSAKDGVGGEAPAVANPPLSSVGDPCVDESSCPSGGSGTPACLTGTYAGGYCAVVGCATHGHDCPGDGATAQCVLAPTATCLRLCRADSDCRVGYGCVDEADAAGHGTAKVCLPR